MKAKVIEMTRQLVKMIINDNQYNLEAFQDTQYQDLQCILMDIYNCWTPAVNDSSFNQEKEYLLDYITKYYNPFLQN